MLARSLLRPAAAAAGRRAAAARHAPVAALSTGASSGGGGGGGGGSGAGSSSFRWTAPAAGAAGFAAAATAAAASPAWAGGSAASCEAAAEPSPPPPTKKAPPPPTDVDGRPLFTRADVAAHASPADGVWVTYKGGVYDVTAFLESHPGGAARLLLAAGGAIDPFWAMYAQHQTAAVAELLEGYRIGSLDPAEVAASAAAAAPDDPYAADPPRHPALRVITSRPFNGETPPALLGDAPITPTPLFYVRNHLPVPAVSPADADAWTVTIASPSLAAPLVLTLADLRTRFPRTEVVATLQCSGNRRNELSATGRPIKGLEWDAGAISTATWAGARLADVLAAAGVPDDAAAASAGIAHVHFEGADSDGGSDGPGYAASIPAHAATDPRGDVLLAYEMNGAPLPPDHGFPVRALVPGVTAARSVKWLTRVVLAAEECPSHWQQKDYKTFSPGVDWATVDWAAAPAIQETNVTSAICEPAPGAVLEGPLDEVEVRGFAYSGGGRGIQRVDVSADGGATWTPAAEVASPPPPPGQARGKTWAWAQWRAVVPLPPGTTGPVTIVARAVDEACNVQPESAAAIWNLRGERRGGGEGGGGGGGRAGRRARAWRARALSSKMLSHTHTHHFLSLFPIFHRPGRQPLVPDDGDGGGVRERG